MSRDRACEALRLAAEGRAAHTEYTSHRCLMSRVTGLPEDHADLARRFYEAWQIDLVWNTNDGPVPWKDRGRVTDMGHAEFLADGSDRRDARACPFRSVEAALAFDAVEEYGLPEFNGLVALYESSLHARQAALPETLVPGGYYKTIVSGAIEAFGWDMLLQAAADPRGFDRVLDGFYQLSLHHYKAWAATSAEVFICHDDMVWSQGPFIHPDFYRSAVFPRYKKLWEVLKQAGKIVLYCSDGDWTMFMDDIAAAGADGFIFEPMTSFRYAAEKHGRTRVIVGSEVDCRTLTFGSRDEIKAQVDASLRIGLRLPGWIAAVGNHIAPNVPVENALFYFDCLNSRRRA